MTTQDHQIRYSAAFEPVPGLPAFRKDKGCDLCELWVVRNLQNGCVNCVNFARPTMRGKRAVTCVNFGLFSHMSDKEYGPYER